MMTMPNTPSPVAPSTASPAGSTAGAPAGRLVSTDGRSLPLTATSLEVRASGGVARVTLQQRFVNPHDEALAVRYQVPLPADGAVSGFAFQLGDRRIVGVIDEKARARARYEEAIVEGRSAALLEQDRSSLFTQEVGNIPPRSEIIAEIQIDQKLRWLAEGSWEWRFPTVVGARYSGSEGRVADASRLAVDVAAGELDVRAALTLGIEEPLSGAAESPSHAIVTSLRGAVTEVALRAGGARLDRDVVVRWPVVTEHERVALTLARPAPSHPHASSQFGLLTVIPPKVAVADVPRDLVLLIDTSGSMQGEPLAQARRVCLALVESLGDDDQLEMIEFSWKPTRWKPRAVAATEANKKAARQWLAALEASGGTEMRDGILAALAPLRADGQRQVIVISDGLIGFESEILKTVAERLPSGCRVHTVGVGSSVNRSLTAALARGGRGVEQIVGIGEDAERAAARMVAHTAQPVVVELTIRGAAVREVAPARLPDLLAGAPLLVAVELDPAGGSLELSGVTPAGPWSRRIEVPAAPPAGDGHAFIAPLFARERVEDLELERATGGARVDAAIERLGVAFQIATRLTSWVAVSDEVTVDPTAPSRREQMPHELPHGMSLARLGLREAAPPMTRSRSAPMPAMARGLGSAGAPPPPSGQPPMGPPRMAQPPMAPAPGRAPTRPPSPGAPEPSRQKGRMAPPREAAEEDKAMVADGAADAFGAAEEDAEGGTALRMTDSHELKKLEVERELLESSEHRPEPGAARGASAAALELHATIVLQQDERLVVAVAVSSPFRWEPVTAVLELADGSEMAVDVLEALTTRPTNAQPGQLLRLAIRWTGGALSSTPRCIRVTTPAGVVTLRI